MNLRSKVLVAMKSQFWDLHHFNWLLSTYNLNTDV